MLKDALAFHDACVGVGVGVGATGRVSWWYIVYMNVVMFIGKIRLTL